MKLENMIKRFWSMVGAGLSQDKVAAILGVSQGVVSKWLRGVYVL